MRFVETIAPARLGTGFRWLLASSWTSNLGDGVAVAAGPLLVASLTHDPFLVALGALLRWAPQLVFGLSAGIVADRLDRRLVVVTADLTRACVLAVLVVALLTGTARVEVALVALGLLTTAEVFADTTSGTLLPMLVARDDLGVANARLMTGFITVNNLVGPPLGAALFAVGRAWPFVGQAVLVGAGAGMASRLVLRPHGRGARRAGQGHGARRELGEGLRWVLHHSAVRTLTLTILIFNVTFGAAWSVLVLYADERLRLGAVGFGLITTVQAAGGLLTTTAYGWITRHVSLGTVMRVGLVTETLTHLALALTTTAWVALPVFFVFGCWAFVWGTTSTTVRQRAVPIELQGRVGGVYLVAVFGGLVAGSAVGGALASAWGVTAPFWFAFAGSAIFLALVWRELSRVAQQDERAAGVS